MRSLKSPFPKNVLRGALVSALTSVALLGSSAWAQKEPPPGEEPIYRGGDPRRRQRLADQGHQGHGFG